MLPMVVVLPAAAAAAAAAAALSPPRHQSRLFLPSRNRPFLRSENQTCPQNPNNLNGPHLCPVVRPQRALTTTATATATATTTAAVVF